MIFRFVLPAVLGVTLGFFALAFAIENEATYTESSLTVLSPGLQVAEATTPAKHESMASTFGNFLRRAIAVNAAYYFAILSVLAWLLERILWRRNRSNGTLRN